MQNGLTALNRAARERDHQQYHAGEYEFTASACCSVWISRSSVSVLPKAVGVITTFADEYNIDGVKSAADFSRANPDVLGLT